MNILFLTLSNVEDITQRGIFTDLIRELSNKNMNIYVVSPRERREELPTKLSVQENVTLLNVRTGNITATKNILEKGVSTIMIERQYLQAIKKHFKNVQFDMIMYSTPPITFNKIITYYKRHHRSKSYLILKDIFPQNAVDLRLIKDQGILHNFFRRKEIDLYKISDVIGVMSQGNIDYIVKHNDYIDRGKIEIFPNAILPIERATVIKKNKKILEKYGIPIDSTLFIYGGNLGKPQDISFVLKVIEKFYKVKKAHLVIVGNGTEFTRLNDYVINTKPVNVSAFKRLPKEEYDKLIESADVGLIFLDHRFSIPNMPSRLTSYMENSLPILASTDKNTDLKEILVKSGSGFWCESIDEDIFIDYANKLSQDKTLREQMGMNGRNYLEENYDIRKTVDTLVKHLVGDV